MTAANDGPEELIGEMASLETLGLQNGGKVEVEVFFKLDVQVQGKGVGYNDKVEVGPEETMDVIETRVSFYRMFKARGYQTYAPDLDRVFDNEELSTTLFRDSQLKNNSKIVLREPVRQKLGPDGEPIEDSEEEDEDMEEGEAEMEEGEMEMIEMGEEGEMEMEEGEGVGDDDADDAAKKSDAGDDENADEDG